MGTVANKLAYLGDTKVAIKDAIVAKGVDVPVGTSFRNYATKISQITSGAGVAPPVAETWTRPSEWLALPDNQVGVQKVSILNAVFDTDSEYASVVCSTTSVGYTVDWGDGTVENFNSNTIATHKYSYADVDLNSATVASYGYKQCIITITPQGSENLLSVNLNVNNSAVWSSASYDLASGFLDIRVNGSYITLLEIGKSSDYVKHSMLEQCLIGEHSCISFAYLFKDCFKLQSVNAFNIAGVTALSNMFQNCYSLQKCPNFTFRTDANMTYDSMFSGCSSLIETPVFNIKVNTSVNNMFASCYSIFKIEINITSSVYISASSMFSGCDSLYDLTFTLTGGGKLNNVTSMFSNCYTLREVPSIDWSAVTSLSTTFFSCESLVSIPTLNTTTALTSCIGAFSVCRSLKVAPTISNTQNVTNMSAMFNGCTSLVSVPLYDTQNVTDMSSMFTSCDSLKTVPLFNTVKVTTFASMFSSCDSLISVPAFNTTAQTGGTNVVSTCYSLKKFTMPTKYTFSVINAKMSATALDEMYTALPTVTAQTVTVTGNYGTASDNPSIATSRGWTVVG